MREPRPYMGSPSIAGRVALAATQVAEMVNEMVALRQMLHADVAGVALAIPVRLVALGAELVRDPIPLPKPAEIWRVSRIDMLGVEPTRRSMSSVATLLSCSPWWIGHRPVRNVRRVGLQCCGGGNFKKK